MGVDEGNLPVMGIERTVHIYILTCKVEQYMLTITSSSYGVKIK